MEYLVESIKSHWAPVFVVLFLRYVILAGGAFLLVYKGLSRFIMKRKIQECFPETRQYWMEFKYSVATTAIFTIVGWVALGEHARPYTLIYTDLNEYGMPYFYFSLLLMIIVHDCYFYWTHRLMHWKPLYKYFHKVHHLSTNPSPWTTFSFHPLEAVVEAGIIFVFAYVFPVHIFGLVFFMFWMTIINVYGHTGFEMFPKFMTRSRMFRHHNTTTNHNLHHKYFNGNYGLYFTWWDDWMGTTLKQYPMAISEIQEREFIVPDQRQEWDTRIKKFWMLTPFIAVGTGLFIFQNAWSALLLLHVFIVIALLKNKRELDWSKIYKGGRLVTYLITILIVACFAFWLHQHALSKPGYSTYLSQELALSGLSGYTTVLFIFYICVVDPILGETFWRGLFNEKSKSPILADVCYGLYHLIVLYPFTNFTYALSGALILFALGYIWRQISNREEGLAVPIVSHMLVTTSIVLIVVDLVV
ncbi:MAG: sterol desaturase family protein [Lentisphaeraceae bacterium]|nr:sterol desaturase family protein [Lentisphaeraceae bacterium]